MPDSEITCMHDGPLIIRGDFELLDGEGRRFGLGGRKQLGLCRCGASENKPFCDGSHKGAAFSSTTEARDLPPVAK